jgi:hypothetical protein
LTVKFRPDNLNKSSQYPVLTYLRLFEEVLGPTLGRYHWIFRTSATPLLTVTHNIITSQKSNNTEERRTPDTASLKLMGREVFEATGDLIAPEVFLIGTLSILGGSKG